MTNDNLKIKLINIRFRKFDRRAEEHFIAVPDLNLSQASGANFAVAFHLAFSRQVGYVNRKVTEIDRLPQDDGFHGAVVNVPAQLTRQGQADDVELPRLALLLDGLGSGGKGNGGQADDSFQIGMRLDHILGPIDAEPAVLLALVLVEELHLRIALFAILAHALDPLALVGRLQRARQDADLAFRSHLFGQRIQERVGDVIVAGLIDEILPAAVGVGVEGENRDPFATGFLQDARNAGRVVWSDSDAVIALGDPLL